MGEGLVSTTDSRNEAEKNPSSSSVIMEETSLGITTLHAEAPRLILPSQKDSSDMIVNLSSFTYSKHPIIKEWDIPECMVRNCCCRLILIDPIFKKKQKIERHASS